MFAEEEEPSAETLSVVAPDSSPPINKTSPVSSGQHMWTALLSSRVTAAGEKVPLA